MSEPLQDPTKLDEAADKLRTAMDAAMTACGWPGRTDVLPPRQPVAPQAWVDMPTLAGAAMEGVPSGVIAATFPVVVCVDGATREQVAQLRKLIAHGWAHLDRVDRARVITAGPQFLELAGGMETRAVVFSVQVALQARTLCSGSLTVSHEAPPAPPAP